MTSDGQSVALEQTTRVADQSAGLLEIVEVREPASAGNPLIVDLSIECQGYKQEPAGLKLRARERVRISISALFPLEPPRLDFADKRHAGAPHVQWGSYVCLYQAPQTEWQPEDGMFGFLQRVDQWLTAAAAGELDPVGLPLHPPAVYADDSVIVIPTVNTPAVGSPWWAGYAVIPTEEERWIELGDWVAYDGDVPEVRLAPAILLPNDMPFEYPTTVSELKQVLEDRLITLNIIQTLMTLGVLRSAKGKPLYFVLGAAMRGTVGEVKRQHLACWCIDAAQADELREAVLSDNKTELKAEFFSKWASTAKIDWRRVYEQRPEIVTSRDDGSDAAWWRGRNVAILGCGAIGSSVAMLLTRAGVAKMQLFDKGKVTPGLLVRQQFDRRQLGQAKAAATRFNVRYANPAVRVEASGRDILRMLQDDAAVEALCGADAIIDATASRTVAIALEQRLGKKGATRPAIISMALGHTAEHGLLTCAAAGATGTGYDLDRRCKLALARSPDSKAFLDEFWPVQLDRASLFQPEPGCSDPTYRGSATDVVALSSAMLNRASRWMANPSSSIAMAMRAPAAEPKPQQRDSLHLVLPPDQIVSEWQHGYEIRLDPDALDALLGWMRRSARLRGPRVETGGILFGEVNELLKTVWISEVTGPPPDSRASASSFVCGTQGVLEMNIEKKSRSRGSIQFIGMWHTHPGGRPDPSETDRQAMKDLLTDVSFQGRNFLMLIVGGSAEVPDMACGLYERPDV
jgi:integrative and conjugative element protein (TIGR02256 family)